MGPAKLAYTLSLSKMRWVQLWAVTLYMSLFVLPHRTAAVRRQARQVIGEEAAGGQPALSDQTAVDCGIFLHVCPQNN